MIKYFFIVISFFLITGCVSDNEEKTLVFIGDSIVARWDIEEYFPILISENHGVSGSGVRYLQTKKNNYINKDVVVLSGTNDLSYARNIGYKEYAEIYLEAINSLGADRIFLFPILPRNFKGDRVNINSEIDSLNYIIREKLKNTVSNITYIDVTPYFKYNGGLNMNLSYDGLHLNNYGYEILAKELKKCLY